MKFFLGFILIFTFWTIFAQEGEVLKLRTAHFEKFSVKDTIHFWGGSTQPFEFEVFNDTIPIDPKDYEVGFVSSELVLKKSFFTKYTLVDSLNIQFKTYPDFLTKTHRGNDTHKIFPNFILKEEHNSEEKIDLDNYLPFEGMETQGNLIRGITVGNNQDAVLNSTLNLRISGKLTPKVSLNAHINDTNIPMQENGYSQELKDVDRIFIEMEADHWKIDAGDIMLVDSTRYFMNFTKKIQGVSVYANNEKLSVGASGALVKGKYSFYQFQGIEGNQGPYKLQGDNGELYIFIIENSERVYINGILQHRGENADYTIDYNSGEITFTPTNPINSESRITVEYQYSERFYARFLTYNQIAYQTDQFHIGWQYYNESDMKNQTMDGHLTDEQKEILSGLDHSVSTVFVPNAVETPFQEGKILYKKNIVNGEVRFEYSNDTDTTLYAVDFTYVGQHNGDYSVLEYLAEGKKMEYVGENQGDYRAVIPLYAPNSLQILSMYSEYKPNEKTRISIESAVSDYDSNLFSSNENKSAKAPAFSFNWQQVLSEKKWKSSFDFKMDYIHKKFRNLEGIYDVEFSRDWDVEVTDISQFLTTAAIATENEKTMAASFQFENLRFAKMYIGNISTLDVNFHPRNWTFTQNTRYLYAHKRADKTRFLNNRSSVLFKEEKWWTQLDFILESKEATNPFLATNNNSHNNRQEKWTIAFGDSTKFNLKTGLHLLQNDSLRSDKTKSNTRIKVGFIQTEWLKSENVALQAYFHIRSLEDGLQKINSLNTKWNYRQKAMKGLFHWTAEYRNTSGQLAQQDFNYVETSPGQGFYTWIDYNENGIKELDEFEIAVFADQANYLRISLPHISYLPTQEAAFSYSLTFHPSIWKNEKNGKKWWSHWTNYTRIEALNSKKKSGNSNHINPFDFHKETSINYLLNFSNQLFFNQNQNHYTTSYTYGTFDQKKWNSFGSIDVKNTFHQLDFYHLFKEKILFSIKTRSAVNETNNETFINRNFSIKHRSMQPALTYKIGLKQDLKIGFDWGYKRNNINEAAQLHAYKWQLNYQLETKNANILSISTDWIKNDFMGNTHSAVGFHILEGLQPGNNFVWNLLWTKKLNKFLFLNLNYNGRANDLSRTIHNGSVQMRAAF